jgi:hypothetical protein
MIWLTWRQLRAQATVVYAAVAVVALALAFTAAAVSDFSKTTGAAFLREFAGGGGRATLFYLGYFSVIAMPAIVGVFWGAPLLTRELESGTHRLAWNQSVTRTRWLATKLAITGLAAMAATALLSLVVSWWCHPIDAAVNAGHGFEGVFSLPRLSPAMFDARGIAPIGYAAFALALGVTAGAVIRRTVPAMALTLAVFVAIQIAMPTWVRPHIAPERFTTTITESNFRGMQARLLLGGQPAGPVRNLQVDPAKPGAWVIANQTVDSAGRVVAELPAFVALCVPPPVPGAQPRSDPAGCFARLARLGYRQRITYQPAGRYWTFQAYETAIFLALALALSGFCFWWVRHRLT